ncbi:glycoside hydrolase [Hortaea werneckii]|nr:glycoside hydrolase [Hortaea werneckii]
MASALQVVSLLSLSLFGVVQCQNASSNVNDSSTILDLPSYMHYINATRNDPSPVTLNIDLDNKSARNSTASDLYGLMHEDISHSGDGGIYAELLANRAFQGSNYNSTAIPGFNGSLIGISENPIEATAPVLTAWAPIGDDVRMTLDRLHPVSKALPTAMEIDFPLNASGEVGFQNFGWWGMDVSPQEYQVSFYVLGNYPRNQANLTTFHLSLRSNLTGEVYATSTISDVAVPYIDYLKLSTTLHPNMTAPNSNNTLVVSFDGDQVKGQTYYFGMFSLMPETFMGTPNGLRKDIAEAFYDMKPSFLRFPGGNNLEGLSPQQRWKWWETLGPLVDRPGRVGDWGYYNTQGLGLMEYLQWTEDMGIERMLAVYAGFSLDVYGQSGASYPEDQMHVILQEALDELEFCMGNTSTYWGARRAALGHPEPFPIKYVEIGNEDWFSSTYPYRWPYLYNGLKQAYPDIQYISSAYDENEYYNISIPAGEVWDTHHYEEPSYFVRNFDFYDNWQERTNNSGVEVSLGEYSAIQIDTPSGIVNYSFPADLHIFYPRLVSALAEGVYLLGMERNPNVCKFASFAPSLQDLNWYNWTPDMIAFDADPSHTVLSASYWQQWLFAHYRGHETLPVTNTEGDFNPLFWVATIDNEKNAVYLKVINILNASVPLTVNMPQRYQSVNGTILTGADLNSYNYIYNQTEVIPKPINFTNAPITYSPSSNGSFQWEVPRYSLNVLQFGL